MNISLININKPGRKKQFKSVSLFVYSCVPSEMSEQILTKLEMLPFKYYTGWPSGGASSTGHTLLELHLDLQDTCFCCVKALFSSLMLDWWPVICAVLYSNSGEQRGVL